jgi:primary-amine oxidase
MAVGDYGLGNCTSSLSLGCDCLGNIHYFDATLSNSKGEAVLVPKAVCMHEGTTALTVTTISYT